MRTLKVRKFFFMISIIFPQSVAQKRSDGQSNHEVPNTVRRQREQTRLTGQAQCLHHESPVDFRQPLQTDERPNVRPSTQRKAITFNSIPYNSIQSNAIRFNVIQCDSMQYNRIPSSLSRGVNSGPSWKKLSVFSLSTDKILRISRLWLNNPNR